MKPLCPLPTASLFQDQPAIPGAAVRPCDPKRKQPGSPTISGEPGRWDVAFAALVFFALATAAVIECSVRAAWFTVKLRALGAWRWLILRRVCAWCKTNLGGNPLARTTSHGICPCCFAAKKAQIRSYSAAVSSRTTTANTLSR